MQALSKRDKIVEAAGLCDASTKGHTTGHAVEEVAVEVVIGEVIEPVVVDVILEAALEETILGVVPFLGPTVTVANLKDLYGKLVDAIVCQAVRAHVLWIMNVSWLHLHT